MILLNTVVYEPTKDELKAQLAYFEEAYNLLYFEYSQSKDVYNLLIVLFAFMIFTLFIEIIFIAPENLIMRVIFSFVLGAGYAVFILATLLMMDHPNSTSVLNQIFQFSPMVMTILCVFGLIFFSILNLSKVQTQELVIKRVKEGITLESQENTGKKSFNSETYKFGRYTEASSGFINIGIIIAIMIWANISTYFIILLRYNRITLGFSLFVLSFFVCIGPNILIILNFYKSNNKEDKLRKSLELQQSNNKEDKLKTLSELPQKHPDYIHNNLPNQGMNYPLPDTPINISQESAKLQNSNLITNS